MIPTSTGCPGAGALTSPPPAGKAGDDHDH
jgi:hypothetical protein